MTIIDSLSTETQFESYIGGQKQHWKVVTIWKGHLNLPAYQMLLWVLIQMGVSHSYIFEAGSFQGSDGLCNTVSVAGLPTQWSAAFHLGLFYSWQEGLREMMILNARRIFHVATGEECRASGHSPQSRFWGLWNSRLCAQLMDPGGLSIMYCGREKGLMHQGLDLWNHFFSLIYIYINRASLTLRGLWCWMRSQLKC